MNKYTSNSSKGCVLEVDLEYPTELRELQNNYPLATDKIRIKREVLSDYLLKIANLYNIPIADSAANKGWSMVHYHQSSDFDCPCIVCFGVSPPPPASHSQKHHNPLILKIPLKSANYPSPPLFRQSPPPNILFFLVKSPPKNKIFQWTLIIFKF